jgi:GNAT superfamily N-acetyltransferase
MAVIRHVLDPETPGLSCCQSGEWTVFPLDDSLGLEAVRLLFLVCNADSRAGPRLSPAGLRAELAGREGRSSVGFLARSAAAGPDADAVGLALVIEARGMRGRRFSLAWLLVHPAFRRQGVASALVSHALAYVRSRGGQECSVETLSSWPDAVAFWRRVAT